jgi:hypothetical protein
MTTNRLAIRAAPSVQSGYMDLGPFPTTPQGWVDRGNLHLARIKRAHELEWVLSNGQPKLQHQIKVRAA